MSDETENFDGNVDGTPDEGARMKKTSKLKLGAETIRVLADDEAKRAAGGYTNTCLGTECQCAPTYGPNCPTNGYTNCKCSAANTNCGCHDTVFAC